MKSLQAKVFEKKKPIAVLVNEMTRSLYHCGLRCSEDAEMLQFVAFGIRKYARFLAWCECYSVVCGHIAGYVGWVRCVLSLIERLNLYTVLVCSF